MRQRASRSCEGEGDWPDHFVMLPRGTDDLGVWTDWTDAWLEAQQLTGNTEASTGPVRTPE